MADELEPFGFEIEYEDQSWRHEPQAGWRVHLPHQCDAWDIAGDTYDLVTREEAITELERFITEAQATLAELRTAPETPRPKEDWE